MFYTTTTLFRLVWQYITFRPPLLYNYGSVLLYVNHFPVWLGSALLHEVIRSPNATTMYCITSTFPWSLLLHVISCQPFANCYSSVYCVIHHSNPSQNAMVVYEITSIVPPLLRQCVTLCLSFQDCTVLHHGSPFLTATAVYCIMSKFPNCNGSVFTSCLPFLECYRSVLRSILLSLIRKQCIISWSHFPY